MTTDTRLYSADEAAAHAPCLNWELVRGRIVPMPPTRAEHGIDVMAIGHLLSLFNDATNVGYVGGSSGLITETAPDTLRAADVIVVSHARYAQITSNGYFRVMPELIVEVKSPSNSWPELHAKAAEYLAAGADRVWIFDRASRKVRVYTGVVRFFDLGIEDTLEGDGLLTGFRLSLSDFFATR